MKTYTASEFKALDECGFFTFYFKDLSSVKLFSYLDIWHLYNKIISKIPKEEVRSLMLDFILVGMHTGVVKRSEARKVKDELDKAECRDKMCGIMENAIKKVSKRRLRKLNFTHRKELA